MFENVQSVIAHLAIYLINVEYRTWWFPGYFLLSCYLLIVMQTLGTEGSHSDEPLLIGFHFSNPPWPIWNFMNLSFWPLSPQCSLKLGNKWPRISHIAYSWKREIDCAQTIQNSVCAFKLINPCKCTKIIKFWDYVNLKWSDSRLNGIKFFIVKVWWKRTNEDNYFVHNNFERTRH